MLNPSDRWTWARCLAEEGVVLTLRDGKLWPERPVTDPQVIEFIRKNRDAITEELKQ